MILKNILHILRRIFIKDQIININKIDDSEEITRFIFSRKQYSIENKIVKTTAFYPPPTNDPNNISVFRIKSLSENSIWELGYREVALKRRKDIKVRGDMIVGELRKEDVNIEPYTKDMHIRHANIILPSDELRAKTIASKIATLAILKINPRQSIS